MLRKILYAMILVPALIGLSGMATSLGFVLLILPGLVLYIAPTVALYVPFVDAVLTTLRRGWWLATLAIAGVWAGLFVQIPSSTNSRLDGQLAIETGQDFGDPVRAPIGDLLLWDWPESVRPAGVCGQLCTRLLVSGVADSVVVPMAVVKEPPNLSGGYAGGAAVYTVRRADVCEPVDGASVEADRDILAEIGAGACIVRRPVNGATFDTALTTIDAESPKIRRFDSFDIGIVGIERRSLWRCAADQCRRDLVRTTVETRRLRIPLMIGVKPVAGILFRDVARRPVTINDTTDHAVLGLGADFVPDGRSSRRERSVDPAPMRAAALRVLTRTADEARPLTEAETVLVNDTLSALYHQPTLTEADHRLLATIVRHPILDGEIYLTNFFVVRPEARDPLAEDLIETYDRLSQRGPSDQARQRRQIAEQVGLLSPAEFRGGQAVILAAVTRDRALQGAPALLVSLGDYGAPALPVLSAALDDTTLSTTHVALGLCRIGADAGSVAARLAAIQGESRQGNTEKDRAVALALARIGRPDLIVRPRRPNPFAGNRRRDPGAWYDGLVEVTPRSASTVCTQDEVRRYR